ncbi:OadG family protein [Aminobacterium sp. UBA4834]|uniref:OadG family protein n=1 Tax=Aminobacterium sp. UBA4834 TaxID=1946022 RepID=UPI00257F57A5|nr:OadG family protein [Aminobacterium sp. UBA4834]
MDLHTYFETGIKGPITLALIAFSAVFLVLGGLTAIIYAIKYMGGVKETPKGPTPPSGPSQPVPAAPVPTASPAPVSEHPRGHLIAAITGALLASGEGACRITSIRAERGIRRPSPSLWRTSAIMEGLDSLNNQTWSGR